MNAKLLIFDFDGTIVDSRYAYFNSFYKNISPYGFSKKQIDEAIDLGLGITPTLKKVGFGFAFSLFLKLKIMSDVLKNIKKIKKCKNFYYLRKIKTRRILISSSLSEFIIPVLRHLKIKHYFSEIYGAENFSDKAEFIKKYLKERKINKKNVFYVGDRVIDAEVAKKTGCKSIIISGKCSWSSRKDILNSKPDFIVDDLGDVAEIVN